MVGSVRLGFIFFLKMAARCPVCEKSCKNTYAIACNICDKWYHCDCAKMNRSKFNHFERELKNPEGERWYCETCNRSEVRAKIMSPKNEKNSGESSFRSNTKNVKEYTLNDVMDKLQNIEQHQFELLKKYEEQLKINEELKQEIDLLKADLQQEKNRNEQKQIENNIIINGIPKTNKNENLTSIMNTICEALNVDVAINKCYRIGKMDAQTPPIKVCFGNTKDKEVFMKAKKDKKMTTKSLGFGNNEDCIYVNHDLTKLNQYIYMLARKFRKENNYKHIWFSEGNTYLRKDDKSKVIKITDEKDLKNLKGILDNQGD